MLSDWMLRLRALIRRTAVEDDIDAELQFHLDHQVQAHLARGRSWSYPIWLEIHRRQHLFEDSAAWSFTRFDLSSGGETQFVDGLWVSGSFFEALGVKAAVGRTLSARDDERNGWADGPVAV